MASLNKVLLMGNLTRDPELRYTPQGSAVATIGLAINNSFKSKTGEKKDDTCFVNVVVWSKQAENCNQYLQKGSPVLVEGRLQYRSWQDQEGRNRSVLEVVASNVQFLGNRGQASVAETGMEPQVDAAMNAGFMGNTPPQQTQTQTQVDQEDFVIPGEEEMF